MRKHALIACLALAALFVSAPPAEADNYALIVSAGEATADDAATNSCFWYFSGARGRSGRGRGLGRFRYGSDREPDI